MSWVVKADFDWLEQHAEFKDGGWVCKKTGADIHTLRTGRSIWTRPFAGGGGEVRQVDHLWCTGCGKQPDINYGKPIYSDELSQTS